MKDNNPRKCTCSGGYVTFGCPVHDPHTKVTKTTKGGKTTLQVEFPPKKKETPSSSPPGQSKELTPLQKKVQEIAQRCRDNALSADSWKSEEEIERLVASEVNRAVEELFSKAVEISTTEKHGSNTSVWVELHQLAANFRSLRYPEILESSLSTEECSCKKRRFMGGGKGWDTDWEITAKDPNCPIHGTEEETKQ